MKSKDILKVFEGQIDKIVLGLIALVSVILLWFFVIGNPYGVSVDGRKYGPGDIDRHIKQKADRVGPEMERPAEPMPYNKTFLADYSKNVQSACSKVASLSIPSAGESDVVIEEERMYVLPAIPLLTDVAIASLRGAAQIPTEDVGPDRPYKSVVSEIGDIDLVSVSAKFNAQTLYNNFQQSFMSTRLKTSWQDAVLAKPVLARLDLQRRTQQSDGSWGSWETVPRAKIDTYKNMLEELPETLNDAEVTVDFWKSQFANAVVQRDIMQPEAYLFTVSRSEWMPPKYLTEALDIMKKGEQTRERQRREDMNRLRNPPTAADARRTAERRTPAQRQQQQQQQRPGGRRGQDDMMMPGGMPVENPAATARAEARKERTLDDVKKDMQKDMLTEKSTIETMREPVLVWAHDDTAAPGKTYQYRIRLGAFNPIAGKDWFQDDQVAYKGQTILWSEFSAPTAEMYIPRRVYAFPMEVIAKAGSSGDVDGVKVEVNKYYLGQWRDFDFEVYPGQIIGFEVEDTDKANTALAAAPMMGGGMDQPKTVDFSTDLMLVDVNPMSIWSKRPIYQVLYCDTEQKIRQMAVGRTNWDDAVRKDYEDIQNAKQQALQQRTPEMMPGMPGMPGMPPGGIPPELMPGGNMPGRGFGE